MFKKIFGFKKKDSKEKSLVEDSREQELKKYIDLEITTQGNFIVFDLKEECNIHQYIDTIENQKMDWAINKIPNITLFDGGLLSKIKPKTMYFFENKDENIRYSFYSTEEKIHIDERKTKIDGHIDEITINLSKDTNEYSIGQLKHDETGSTYLVKSYRSENPDYEWFRLEKDEATQLARQTLDNLNKVTGASSIIDINLVRTTLGLSKNEFNEQKITPIKNIEQQGKSKVMKI